MDMDTYNIIFSKKGDDPSKRSKHRESRAELAFRQDLASNKVVWRDDCFYDWHSFLKNNHPLYSICSAPKLHPYSRNERFAVLICNLCLSCLLGIAAAVLTIDKDDIQELTVINWDIAFNPYNIAVSIGFGIIKVLVSGILRFIATCPCLQKDNCFSCLFRSCCEKIGHGIIFIWFVGLIAVFIIFVAAEVNSINTVMAFIASFILSTISGWMFASVSLSICFARKRKKEKDINNFHKLADFSISWIDYEQYEKNEKDSKELNVMEDNQNNAVISNGQQVQVIVQQPNISYVDQNGNPVAAATPPQQVVTQQQQQKKQSFSIFQKKKNSVAGSSDTSQQPVTIQQPPTQQQTQSQPAVHYADQNDNPVQQPPIQQQQQQKQSFSMFRKKKNSVTDNITTHATLSDTPNITPQQQVTVQQPPPQVQQPTPPAIHYVDQNGNPVAASVQQQPVQVSVQQPNISYVDQNDNPVAAPTAQQPPVFKYLDQNGNPVAPQQQVAVQQQTPQQSFSMFREKTNSVGGLSDHTTIHVTPQQVAPQPQPAIQYVDQNGNPVAAPQQIAVQQSPPPYQPSPQQVAVQHAPQQVIAQQRLSQVQQAPQQQAIAYQLPSSQQVVQQLQQKQVVQQPPQQVVKQKKSKFSIFRKKKKSDIDATIPPGDDTWNITPPLSRHIKSSSQYGNAVYRLSYGKWISIFGNTVVNKGENKQWKVKIKKSKRYARERAADIVIGICDAAFCAWYTKKIPAEFWLKPFNGYGYYGWNGRLQSNKKGSRKYATAFQVDDIITIEIRNNTLGFYKNNEYLGVAFSGKQFDKKIGYVLALGFINNKYEVQIL